MASKHLRASGAVAPPGADDFKLIRGIGPGVAHRLHSAGILTFAQLAALSPADIAALVGGLAGLSAERIVAQDWLSQARELASSLPQELQYDASALADRQHYATFTVELLLDEENNVRRTRVAHIQGGNEEVWAGWQEQQLLHFFVRSAALRLPIDEPAVPIGAASESAPEIAPISRQVPDITAATDSPPPSSPVVEARQVAVRTDLIGVPRLHTLEALSPDTATPRGILPHDRPFNVRFTLDLADVQMPRDETLNYTATIYARELGGGARQIVCETDGTIIPADQVTIDVAGIALMPGIYKLGASVALILTAFSASARPGAKAMVEGRPIHVY